MRKQVDFTGTVSEATMKPQDVLPSCMDVLAEYDPDTFDRIVYDIAFGDDGRFTQEQAYNEYSRLLGNDDDPWWDSEDCTLILNDDIWDAMQDIAPNDHYFGAHIGDGCDYGYWPIEFLDF